MSKCTWVDCDADATTPQIARDGQQWANLCERHDKAINESIESADIPKMLGNWVKAQGGAKKAARSALEGLTK